MKDLLAKDIMSLMKDYINSDPDDDFNHRYIGVVEDNKDPEKIGRCKIRVHGIHDSIPTIDLPWVDPDFPLAIGIKGSFIVPEVGTTVFVYFERGDIYQPKYTGKAVDKHNNDFIADKDEDYPDSCILYETKKGDYLKINRRKGEFTLQTAAGVYLKMSSNGDIDIHNESSDTGNCNIKLRGSFNVDNRLGDINLITGNCNLSAFGSITVNSNETVDINSLGNHTIRTNSEFDVVAGDRSVIKSKNEIRTETIKHKTLANNIELGPVVGTTQGAILGEPTFTLTVGDNTKVVSFTVAPEPLGGPFNCIPFDPITGMPHQGRIATGIMMPVLPDAVDKTAEVAKRTATITTNNTKDRMNALANITKNYASIGMQAQLLINGTNSTLLTEQKAIEISATNEYYNNKLISDIDAMTADYLSYLDTPVFEDEQNNYTTYTSELSAADNLLTVASDITGKTTIKDLVGAGKGLVNDE